MKIIQTTENSINKLHNAKRKPIDKDREKLIEEKFLDSDNFLPLVISPVLDGVNLVAWTAKNRDFLEAHLLKYGGIVFRNFNVNGVQEFQEFIEAISRGKLVEYNYRSTPRTQVNDKIYTSTEYPANQSIPLHNEKAYSSVWPMKICFFCAQPAKEGGETPIADSRKVFAKLDSVIKEKFMQKKVMYVRNYGDLDLSWQDVFQTTNKSEVESFCHKEGIEFEWKNDRLTTRQVCQAVAKHPRTGEMVWFNQAHLFHISSLETEIRESLFSLLAEDTIPRNAYYGDGSAIEPSTIEKINQIYQQEKVIFSWQKGDILVLDNMLTAHGRMPFVGARKVLVGMSESC
ncbi:MAG: TauD/TfdA family dioxygenase [Nostoc sp. DedSLP03]|uniref:TauD/TfdA family dioxygenase n=1 Tax=Nostoc sp. DedSLP03 TaxID=3075400 RepID=UPI002AD4D64E|nr:TauD/TfdA family dioxygenase [Nostoc sp. DedSLP03]MDZ7963728.1 TauD/TfdA family dioxygenase [Nostoc sp. DedSLP03]